MIDQPSNDEDMECFSFDEEIKDMAKTEKKQPAMFETGKSDEG